MSRQQTIAAEREIAGAGIHSGRPVRCVLRPAPAGAGVRFVREDLPGRPVITPEHIQIEGSPGRTTLKNGSASVETVEHVLAAAAGMGVDNLEVAMDAGEPPAADGSALPFAQLMAQAGIVEQEADRAVFAVKEPLELSGGGAIVKILPCAEGLRVTYTLDYPGAALAKGQASFLVTPETFLTDIAPARTFCLRQDVERLRAAGLGKGANAKNTLIIDGDRVIDNELRFADEPVRHKILDAIGDLALFGRPLAAHAVCQRSGHELNRRAVAMLKQVAAGAPAAIGRGASLREG